MFGRGPYPRPLIPEEKLMAGDIELLAQLRQAGDPSQLLATLAPAALGRLARSCGLFETVGSKRYYIGLENAARLALTERLRRAGLPYRQHGARPVVLPPDAAALLRAELLCQAEAVCLAAPEALRPTLAALELLLVVAGQSAGSALGEEDRAQLVGEVRALLSSPREAAIVAQARSLAGGLVALLRSRGSGRIAV